MLAFAMMAMVRERANTLTSPQKETTKPSCSAGTLVCPGNPPRGHTPPATPDRACLCNRLVCLATRASGDGANLTSQAEGATVMLGVWWRNVVGIGCVTRLRSIRGALTACNAELLAAGGRDALPSSASPHHPDRSPGDCPLDRAHRRAGPTLQCEHRDRPQMAQARDQGLPGPLQP